VLEQLRLLCEFQKIDLALEEIESVRKVVADEYSALQVKLRELEERFALLEEQGSDLVSESNELESKLALDNEKIQRSEAKLLEIKTTEEYEAGLREIENKRIEIEETETAILEKSELVDRSKLAIKEMSTQIETLRSQGETIRQRYEQVSIETDARKSETAKSKEGLISKIDKRYLARYEFLKKHRQGAVVVGCKDYVCTGCHMGVPPQLYYQLQRTNDEYLSCPSCQRIIFFFKHNLDGQFPPQEEPPPVEEKPKRAKKPAKKKEGKKVEKEEQEEKEDVREEQE